MEITVNGQKTAIQPRVSLAEMLHDCGFRAEAIIVEYNGDIIARDSWDKISLEPDDCLEIVTFVGGG